MFDVVVDIGNTRIKWGRCINGFIQEICALPAEDAASWQQQAQAWQLAAPMRWVVAGVHPERVALFEDWLKSKGFPSAVLRSREQLPIKVDVDQPDSVGLDRLLNAVAVNQRRLENVSAIVVDAGSAVTVDFVDAHGHFGGGSIFPGLGLMALALNTYTAKLPVVEVRRRVVPPGTSTEKAIQTGVFHAVLGGIERLVRELRTRSGQSADVFVGGGDGPLLAQYLPWPTIVWPEMTLEGIRLSGEANPA